MKGEKVAYVIGWALGFLMTIAATVWIIGLIAHGLQFAGCVR